MPTEVEAPEIPGEREARSREGQLLGERWLLERLIGLGGMAAIYSSREPGGLRAAVKVMHPEYATNVALRERFEREARVTASINHQGRVEVFDAGVSSQGEPYFAMELLEGVTLNQLWKQHNQKLPIDYVLHVADRVLDLLSACHAQNLIHRDLKPSNLFVTFDGYVKVLDFGVARLREAGVEPTMVGTALGTPAYMAPEQALGSREGIDPRTDIFAVGAMLHAMITGKRLHEGRSQQEAFVLAATRPAPSVARIDASLPASVVALIDRALQWDKRNRFPDAQSMRDEVARVLAEIASPEKARSSEMPTGKTRMLAALAQAGVVRRAPSSAELEPELVLELRDLFVRIERALTAVRQYGWEHPMSTGPVAALHEQLGALLSRSPEGIGWEVRPHSFASAGGEAIVWEPVHPYDQIPYNLFASGFRSFAIASGITLEELRSLIDLLRRDPLRDFAPEDDLATAFWEKQLEHVSYHVVSSFLAVGVPDDEGKDRGIDELIEAGQQVAHSGRQLAIDEPLSLEARAAVIAARASALRAVRSAAALSLSPERKSEFERGLELSDEEWRTRYVDVLADAACEAYDAGRLELVAVPLRVGIHDALAIGEPSVALELLIKASEAVGVQRGAAACTALIRGVFDPQSTAALLKQLTRPALRDDERAQAARCASALESVLGELGGEHFEAVLNAAARVEVDELRPALLSHLERHAAGNEQQLGALLPEAELGRARAILSILTRLDSDAARTALRQAERSPSPELRVEAIAVRAAGSAEGLRDELARLSVDQDAGIRLAALRTMARYKVKEAGPPLVHHIMSTAFHRLPLEERRLALSTLHELSPARAELMAAELCEKTTLIGRDSLDETRILAIELLERTASRKESLAVLEKTSEKWSNSTPVRAAASRAVVAVRGRLEHGR